MKRFFYFLLIGIAILGLSGLNGAYADTNDNAGQINSTSINKIIDFVQKQGDISNDSKVYFHGLGWEQDHPEWTNRIPYHFLIKGVETQKISGETKIVFNQLWLSLNDTTSFADDPQFQGLKETDLFFKGISVYLAKGNLKGKIIWIFYYRDNLKEIVPLSELEAKDEFSKELNWWIEFIDKAGKK